MKAKHKRTLAAIYAKPIQSGITWTGIEALLVAVEADYQRAVDRVCESL